MRQAFLQFPHVLVTQTSGFFFLLSYQSLVSFLYDWINFHNFMNITAEGAKAFFSRGPWGLLKRSGAQERLGRARDQCYHGLALHFYKLVLSLAFIIFSHNNLVRRTWNGAGKYQNLPFPHQPRKWGTSIYERPFSCDILQRTSISYRFSRLSIMTGQVVCLSCWPIEYQIHQNN